MTDTAEKVLAIATEYLGPSAGKFLDRQTRGHMEDQPFELIEPFHTEKLAFWIIVSAKLLIGKEKAEEFSKRVSEIK